MPAAICTVVEWLAIAEQPSTKRGLVAASGQLEFGEALLVPVSPRFSRLSDNP